MSDPSQAWVVVQIAERARASEELLLRALDTLDVDVRAAMPADGAWTLSGGEAEDLRTLLHEHAETAEQLRTLAERLPQHGVIATYADVRDGAAEAMAQGILDQAFLLITASALDVHAGWAALADALVTTDVREAWQKLTCPELLSAFRDAGRRLVSRVLADAGVDPDTRWSALSTEETRHLAAELRKFAEQL